MDRKVISVKQADGRISKVTGYLSDAEPTASLLIMHGMAEHHERYEDFAGFLNSNGIDVYLYDHRGHGMDLKLEDLGFIAEKDGDRLLINDAITIARTLQKEKRTEKFFLMGHSMGSFVCRNTIQTVDDITGAIICGTNFPSGAVIGGGLFMSGLVKTFKGARHVSPFLNKVMFENKDYLSCSTRTVMDWLTRDNAVVGKYISDPYCGFICTASFYHDLVSLIKRAGKGSNIMKTRKDLPIYFIAGDKDPVGGFGKQVAALQRYYEKHGFTDTSIKLYKECRHEILNELNKQEVYDDVLAFIKSK